MPLSDHEKERVRYHLGYIGVSAASSMQWGIPRPQQTMFLLEDAMSNLMEVSVDRVRRILGVLDGIEDKMIDAQDRLATGSVEELKLRDAEPQRLEMEYVRWASRLADILGCPLCPMSTRFAGGSGGVPGGNQGGNIPVV